jgi:uncharacterized membrane protein YbhN (UPF0104 family)
MQLNKSIKIFINYFFGPLLFAWLAYSIYRQIINQPQLEASWQHIKQSFNSYKIIYLIAALLLIFVNWGIEAWKWKISLDPVYRIPFLKAFEAVLSGVSFSVTMPNRVGEYLGRMMYLPEGNRLRTISITLVGSFSQLLITILLGTIGFIILKDSLLQGFPHFRLWYQFIVYGLVAMLLVLLLIYFNIAGSVGLFKNWIKSERYLYLIEALRNFDTALLLRVFLLSGLRYLVFLLQYILIFYLFEVNVSVATIVCIMSVVFLAMAIIPSIALVEVGLRGEISIRLMTLFTINSLGVGLTSVTVWFMNLILPAIVGSLLILNVRVFKKKNGQ